MPCRQSAINDMIADAQPASATKPAPIRKTRGRSRSGESSKVCDRRVAVIGSSQGRSRRCRSSDATVRHRTRVGCAPAHVAKT